MNVTDATLVLGIETSCDETAAALVMGGLALNLLWPKLRRWLTASARPA